MPNRERFDSTDPERPEFEGLESWWDDPAGKLMLLTLHHGIREADTIVMEQGADRFTIYFEVDGKAHEFCTPPASLVPGLLRYAELLGRGCHGQTPQRARAQLQEDTRIYNLRLMYWPDKIVISRLPGQIAFPKLADLGLSPEQLETWQDLLRGDGLVLVGGPPRSGRSDVLLASMSPLNGLGRSLLTVEDPVERWYPYLLAEDGPPIARLDLRRRGKTFAAALEADFPFEAVIVSELDHERTRPAALEAARTRLVLGAVDAVDAVDALWAWTRYPGRERIRGVLSPRLTRGLCAHCREEVPGGGFRAVGCERCGLGYYRTRGIYELLAPLPPQWWDLPAPGALRQAARAAGMVSLRERWEAVAADGTIRLDHCPPEI